MDYKIQDPANTVIIERSYNEDESGFILKKFEEYTDSDGFYLKTQPIEYDELNHDYEDWDAVVRMLWSLLNMLDVHNNKHSNRELIIAVGEQDLNDF